MSGAERFFVEALISTAIIVLVVASGIYLLSRKQVC